MSTPLVRNWQAVIVPQRTATDPPAHGVVVGLEQVWVDRTWAFTPEDAELIAAAPETLRERDEAVRLLRLVLQRCGQPYNENAAFLYFDARDEARAFLAALALPAASEEGQL